jgi:hypothetical protein
MSTPMILSINTTCSLIVQGANEGTYVVAIAEINDKALLSKILVPVTEAVPALALHIPQ